MKRLTPMILGTATLLLAPLYAAGGLAATPMPAALQSDDGLAGEVEDIIDEYDEKMASFWEGYQALETNEEQNEFYSSHYPDAAAYAKRLQAIIDRAPADAAAATAIAWILDNANAAEKRAGFLEILLEHHSASDAIRGACLRLMRETGADAEHFLRSLIEEAPSRETVGTASYALSGVLGSRISLNETIAGLSDEDFERYTGYYGADAMKLCKDLDLKAVAAERQQLLETIRDEYSDVTWSRGTLGKSAAAELFEMERLQIGMVAPEITGPDLDGIDFKLSDYRGQVVVIDFWGDW